jgi:hypothetical protein
MPTHNFRMGSSYSSPRRNVCLSSRDFPDDLLPLSLSAIQRCSPSFRQRCPVRQKRHLVLSGVHSPSIRPSIGTENPIPEEMDHREIAVRVPVMNEVQFLFASEPCKPLHPRSLYVVFLVEKDVRVKRQRTCDHLPAAADSAGARRCRADSGWTTAARNNTGPDDAVRRDVDGAAEDINRLLTTFAGLS